MHNVCERSKAPKKSEETPKKEGQTYACPVLEGSEETTGKQEARRGSRRIRAIICEFDLLDGDTSPA